MTQDPIPNIEKHIKQSNQIAKALKAEQDRWGKNRVIYIIPVVYR